MELNNYINETFGTNFSIKELDSPKKLPVYMNVGRSFYLIRDKETKIVLVEINKVDSFNVVAYEKQMKEYFDYFKYPIAYVFKNIKKNQRDSLIKRKIPFVSDSQLYLPYIGIYLNNLYLNNIVINTERMMPITQALYIYLAYVLKGEKTIKKEAAKALHVTQTSLSRASDQLMKMDLLYQEKVGKEHYIRADAFSYESFQKAKQLMINPIQESIFVETKNNINKFPLAGISALAKLSMLNDSNIKTVATLKNKEYKKIELEEKWDVVDSMTKVELWKYDPLLFAKNGVVDPISLYMSFNKNNDERIEAELERMIRGE